MTAAELRAIGAARFGSEWQSALARALDISPRHMRRLAAGTAPISDAIVQDLHLVLGGAPIESLAWPRDEWILGDSPTREYILHAHPPRFLARVVETDEDGQTAEVADLLTGLTFSSDEGTTLCEIVWIDAPPPDAELQELLKCAVERVMERS